MWTTLGTIDPTSLESGRLSLHWATQVPAAAAARLLTHRDDYDHTNLGWDAATRALLSRPLGSEVRAGLRPHDLHWIVVARGEVVAQRSADGHTLSEGLAWLAAALTEVLGHDVQDIELLEHDMPEHPVGDGSAFDAQSDEGARAELERWIANAHMVLDRFARDHDDVSDVRLWPHHFDIATTLTLPEREDADEDASVGVGFSFGDDSYAQPYAYVSPWPHPNVPGEDAPVLVHGTWHTEGFFAAVLTGAELVQNTDGQRRRAEQFLAQATVSSLELLGSASRTS